MYCHVLTRTLNSRDIRTDKMAYPSSNQRHVDRKTLSTEDCWNSEICRRWFNPIIRYWFLSTSSISLIFLFHPHHNQGLSFLPPLLARNLSRVGLFTSLSERHVPLFIISLGEQELVARSPFPEQENRNAKCSRWYASQHTIFLIA